MSCFLACFGFSKKQKRRKPANKVPPEYPGHGSYKPLDSDATTIALNITEKPSKSNSEFSNKDKEISSLRLKKKVSFNLTVKTYEPLPDYDLSSCFSESGEKCCEENKETGKIGEDSVASKTGSYPWNHRNQNCRDSYDEEEDIELKESDQDGNDEFGNCDEEHNTDSNNGDDGKMRKQEFSEQFCTLPVESEKQRITLTSAQLGEETTSILIPLVASLDQEQRKSGWNHKAPRDRSRYVFPVLNPVENLTQWKAVKARVTPTMKQQRKENIALELEEDEEEEKTLCRKPIVNPSPSNYKPNSNRPKLPQMQDLAVDASLSNWLVS